LLLLIDGLNRDEEERKVKRERVIWIREWLQRRERGAYNQLVQDLVSGSFLIFLTSLSIESRRLFHTEKSSEEV